MLSANVRVLAFVAACTVVAVSSAPTILAADTKMISSVEVQELDGVTRIVLRGAEDPIYTAFKREDPPRLIVELPDVEFSGIDSPLRVNNGVVNDVTLGAFGDPRVALSMARVTVALAQDVEYELMPEGDELVIELRPVGAAQTTAEGGSSLNGAATPAALAPAEDLAVETAETTDPAPTQTEDAPAAPAPSRILKVRAAENGVYVEADGAIDNIDSFTLDNPSRLVVDFWGVDSKVWPDKWDVDWPNVTRVRVGKHADKVRVVLDLRSPLSSHGVEPASDGVHIHMNAEAAADAADDTAAIELPAAPETATADSAADGEVLTEVHDDAADGEVLTEVHDDAADGEPTDMDADAATEDSATVEPPAQQWSGPGAVENVHFESLPGTDRVVISLNHRVEAEMVSPDEDTLIVMLRDTTISEDSERRVDTSDFGGPVEQFSVFTTPDVDYQEVRVVLKRQAGRAATMTWNEGLLYIELAREGAGAADWDPAATGEAGDPASLQGMAAADPTIAPSGDPSASVAPAAQHSDGTTALPSLAADDPFLLDGPADPAAIDLLAEGGFSEEKEYTGRRISLDFKDADVGNILRLIAEVSDLNVIAGEEVAGRVTIRLVDVPWDQALDVVLLTKGLGFVRVGNVLRIAPIETLKLEAEARLQDRRAKEKLEDLVVKLQPVNYASVKEIKDLVKKLLSKRGTVNTDKRTNTLIIKDIPSVVQEATALVKAIDTATPQVLIETKIVEASLSFSRSLGASWGAAFQPNTASGGLNRGGGGDVHLNDLTTFPNLLPITGGLTNFVAANPIFDANNGFLSLGILGLQDHVQLDLAIEAAETNNKGKVISSPRVVTLDNQEAVIKQGVAIKFEASTRDKITISFIDAVLELKVTPHITANRSIIMKLKISRNAPSLSAATGDIVGIDKNEASTEALVRDGETMVLGGIYVVDNGTSRTKTPFLADIPLLGALFQSKVTQDERRELLIFVTPRIITGTPATTDL